MIQRPVVDVFGREFSVGDIIAYAKHGGYMTIYRVKKINTNSLSAYEIAECDDGYWRERNQTRTTCLHYPKMGMIINDRIDFPYTEQPEVKKPVPVKREILRPQYHYEDDDDD